jgi:hypothetical protein
LMCEDAYKVRDCAGFARMRGFAGSLLPNTHSFRSARANRRQIDSRTRAFGPHHRGDRRGVLN